MAVTRTSLPTGVAGGRTILYDSDADETAETDVMGGATKVNIIVLDNTGNAAIEYLKLWDAKGPVVGTTAPDFILELPASQVCIFEFEEEDSTGTVVEYVTFATALSWACVTAAGTAGVTGPTTAVKMWVHIAD